MVMSLHPGLLRDKEPISISYKYIINYYIIVFVLFFLLRSFYSRGWFVFIYKLIIYVTVQITVLGSSSAYGVGILCNFH